MSETAIFIAAGALLLVAVLALLLRPMWRAAPIAAPQRDTNRAVLRDQLAELERERDEGLLSAADFAQAKSELARRLLEEIDSAAPTAAVTPPSARRARATAVSLLVVVPLAAIAGYLLLGNPDALDPLRRQARVSPQQIEAMLVKLETRLKAQPDDAAGWVMLARSYKVLGRYAEAADAYAHGGALVDNDAELLADYAEVLARSSGSLQGRPGELIARALLLNADTPQALFLAGVAASDAQDYAAVARYWGRLLEQLDPQTQEAQSIAAAVARAREIIASAGGQGAPGEPATAAAQRSETVAGEVTIAGAVAARAQADDLLFVFARPDAGSRMPIAVLRARVGDLPFAFRLDDTQALPGGRKLSEFTTVTLEARVAKSGSAQTASGDLYGSVKGVKPGSQGIRLVIDQVQP